MIGMNGKNDAAITKKTVFIFKAMKENHAQDRYEEILELNSIPFSIIPVLSFGFVNKDALVSKLSQPDRLSAIILTSTRAVEAVDNALQGLNNDIRDLVAALQCFVVGPATCDAAVAVGFTPEGKNCGNGSALAEYIIQKVDSPFAALTRDVTLGCFSPVKDSSKPLLFPCSNIRKENIPETLKSKGLTIKEIVAYETYPDEHIGEYVREAIEVNGLPEYAVFFSPSGFKYVHASSSFALGQTKIIALGPSTATAVTDKGFKLHGTTERPDPESLLMLLLESMSKES